MQNEYMSKFVFHLLINEGNWEILNLVQMSIGGASVYQSHKGMSQ